LKQFKSKKGLDFCRPKTNQIFYQKPVFCWVYKTVL